MKNFTFQAMGSKILIAMDTDQEDLLLKMKEAQEWFELWEQTFSRFRPESELTRLNRKPEVALPVSDTLFEVATLALQIENRTQGLISPKIHRALHFAGYSTSFEELPLKEDFYLGTTESVDDFENQSYYLDKANQTITIGHGTSLDFGGFVKGWAAHQTMLRLQDWAPVLVDAGGDISISRPPENQSSWPIGVANPFQPETPLELIMVNSGGIATSGRDYRRWFFNHEWQHHLIDTRTNKPAETDVITSTVLAKDIIEAEMYSKLGLILGSVDGSEQLQKEADLGFLFILEDGKTLINERLREKTWNYQQQSQLNEKIMIK